MSHASIIKIQIFNFEKKKILSRARAPIVCSILYVHYSQKKKKIERVCDKKKKNGKVAKYMYNK